MTDLSIEYCGMKLQNPTILASGFLGVAPLTMKRVEKSGAGAVTTKSISAIERQGHNNPTVVANEHFMLNAVGLSTAGADHFPEEWDELQIMKIPVIVSIYGDSIDAFVEAAKKICKFDIPALELDMSCPNVSKGGLEFCTSEETAYELVSRVKQVAGNVPVIAKLGPATHLLVEVAKACEKAGASGICAINTMPGMVIDIEARKPVLHFKSGGISGCALKPIAVNCVYKIYKNVKIPICGTGGITTGRDAIEMIMAGATTIGIGTATYYRGVDAFKKICKEMSDWMKKNGYKNLEEIRGIAHEPFANAKAPGK